jgi:hypothetical protein
VGSARDVLNGLSSKKHFRPGFDELRQRPATHTSMASLPKAGTVAIASLLSRDDQPRPCSEHILGSPSCDSARATAGHSIGIRRD